MEKPELRKRVSGAKKACLAAILFLVIYFVSFWIFVVCGHRETRLGGYCYQYLPAAYDYSWQERALAAFYHPASSLSQSLGANISYLNPGIKMERRAQ